MMNARTSIRAREGARSMLLGAMLLSIAGRARAADALGSATTETPAAPTSAPAATGVWLHIDGPGGLELQHDLDSMHADHDPQTICTAPCDRYVASDLRYRLGGGGLKRSAEFALQAPDGGRERIGVRGGSKAWFILGWIGIGVGGATALVGVEVLVAPVLSEHVPGADGRLTSQPTPGHPLLGWSLVGGGVALGAASMLVMSAQRTTTGTQSPGAAPGSRFVEEAAGDLDPCAAIWPRAALAPLLSATF